MQPPKEPHDLQTQERHHSVNEHSDQDLGLTLMQSTIPQNNREGDADDESVDGSINSVDDERQEHTSEAVTTALEKTPVELSPASEVHAQSGDVDVTSTLEPISVAPPSESHSITTAHDRHRSKQESKEQYDQMKAKEDAKIAELKAMILDLERQEQELMQAIRGEGTPSEIIDRHIKELHRYNEIKDVGQIILGKCAEIEGTTIKEQYGQYGLDLDY